MDEDNSSAGSNYCPRCGQRHFQWFYVDGENSVPYCEHCRLQEAQIQQQAAACDYLHMGAHTYGQPLTIRTWRPHYPEKAQIYIGKYCSISPGVEVFLGGNHCTDWISTYPFAAMGWEKAVPKLDEAMAAFSRGDVVIGNDVWVGQDVTIMSGVAIGDGAVIGAKAVVAHDVSPYATVVGNPGEVVSFRFGQQERQWLLNIRWWDWPDERVAEVAGILSSGDIQALVDYAVGHGYPC